MSPGTIPQRTVLGVRAASVSDRFASQEFSLLLVNGPQSGQAFPIGQSLKIGKAPDNDVVLDHPTVSRNHLVIRRQGDQFLVEDLGSTNGTFIDGAQIREGFLRAGALLEVGDVQLRFQPKLKSLEVSPTANDRLGDLVGTSRADAADLRADPAHRAHRLDAAADRRDRLRQGRGGAHHSQALAAGHRAVRRLRLRLGVGEPDRERAVRPREGRLHRRGRQRVGCLERADDGTLFIDEIDDLPLDLQPKLLRALEDREFRRLGQSGGAHKFDTRVIAATKKDLWAETQAGRFREDLYFRLSVFTLTLPTLRDRKEDLPLLVDAMAGANLWGRLHDKQKEQFNNHTWPGNVRELRNAVERLKHVADIPELASENFLREYSGPDKQDGETLPVNYAGPFKDVKDDLIRGFEREYLTRLLSKTRGNIAKAARDAGLDRKHLYSLLHKYGLVQTSEE